MCGSGGGPGNQRHHVVARLKLRGAVRLVGPRGSRSRRSSPDLDTAGARYAGDLVEILRQLQPAPSIRVLELPGLTRTEKNGADIEQWLEGLPDTWEPDQIREELLSLATRAPDSTQPTRAELGLVCFEEIEVEPIDWLWPERILRGSFTLLAGEGEIGKSFLTLDLIARISTGRPFPDQAEATLEPSHCIFVTAEDRLGMTIKPRLLALGADCSKVHTITTGLDSKGKPLAFTIADIGRLDKIMAVQPGIVMIVIDPIAAFLGRVDENKNAELRSLLGPLSDFADRHNVAIVGITHFGKTPSTKPSAKILGSVAYSNASRAAWCVIADPNNPDRRLMLRVKNNLSADKTGMAFTIKDGRVVWELEPVKLSASDVLAESASPKRAEKAEAKKEPIIAGIRRVLANGPMKGDDVKAELAEEGFGKNKVLGVER